jgi:hypothetical protein
MSGCMRAAETVQRGREYVKANGSTEDPKAIQIWSWRCCRSCSNTALASPRAHSYQVHVVEPGLVELN